MLNGRTTQSVNRSTGWFKYSFEPICKMCKKARVSILAHIFLTNVGSKFETSLRWGVGALQGSIVRSQIALMSQNSLLLCNIVSVHRSVCLLCNIVLYKGAPNICWCWYLWICFKEGQVLISGDQRLPLFPAQPLSLSWFKFCLSINQKCSNTSRFQCLQAARRRPDLRTARQIGGKLQ